MTTPFPSFPIHWNPCPRGRPARSTKDTRLLLQRKIVKSRIVYGFICGLLNVLAIGFLIGPLPGLIRGLFIGISYGLLGPLDREIRPTEVVTWSWVSVQRNITRFLGAGLLVGLLYGLVTSLFFGPSYLAHLLFGLIIGASVGLTLGLTSGLSNEKLNDRNRVMPNQGIWNSLWNSVFLGLLYGLVFGVIFGLIYGRILYLIFGSNYVTSFTINSGLVYGPTVGLSIAGAVWLYNGGTACTLHALLRVLLWFAKDIPWNYSHFLDYAAECILLRKVGGGYIFVHRLLLEYFMSLSLTRTSSQLVIEGTPAGQAGVCLCGCPYRPGARFCSNCGRPKKETNPEHVQDISLTQTGPLQN